MPKKTTTAQQRAREAAQAGEKYTAALRARKHAAEIYADPTFTAVRGAVLDLDENLAAFVHQHGQAHQLTARYVGRAGETLARLAAKLEKPAERQIPDLRQHLSDAEADLKKAHQAETHGMFDGVLSYVELAFYQLAIWHVARQLQAVFRATCTEGAHANSPCAPEPGRVVVDVFEDQYGHTAASGQACARHAAEYLLRWEVSECRIRGSRSTAVLAHSIAQNLEAEGFTPRFDVIDAVQELR